MFGKATQYESEIVLGEEYVDKQTGFSGHAVAVVFYQHGCERVTLKGLNGNGEIVEYGFDAPEIRHKASGQPVKAVSRKTGGPHDRNPMRRP